MRKYYIHIFFELNLIKLQNKSIANEMHSKLEDDPFSFAHSVLSALYVGFYLSHLIGFYLKELIFTRAHTNQINWCVTELCSDFLTSS